MPRGKKKKENIEEVKETPAPKKAKKAKTETIKETVVLEPVKPDLGDVQAEESKLKVVEKKESSCEFDMADIRCTTDSVNHTIYVVKPECYEKYGKKKFVVIKE